MTTYLQDPGEALWYSFDFTPALDDAETVVSYTVTASAGLTKVEQSRDGAKVFAKFSGGTDGTYYTVTWNVVTSTGQTFERSDRIRVTQL